MYSFTHLGCITILLSFLLTVNIGMNRLFGFSRGAFTARTIVSLISDIGILTNQGMEDFYKIFAAYQARANPECQKGIEELERFLDDYREGGVKSARKMPPGTLKCVGVWDTVGALGIRKEFTSFIISSMRGSNKFSFK